MKTKLRHWHYDLSKNISDLWYFLKQFLDRFILSSSRDGTVRKINIATRHPCGLQSNSKASISDDKNEGSDVKHKLREAKEKHGETKYQQCNTKSDARDDLCDAHVKHSD